MREFVELRGASGASYRFRLWGDGQGVSPVAGNYAVVKHASDGFTVMFTAVTNDLSRPPGTVRAAINESQGVCVYMRLNISRSVREAEDADISAHYGAPQAGDPAPKRTASV